MKKTRSPGAFTLVELLVVIGIIALLISVLLPALHRARMAAMTIKCSARMQQLVQATMMYANSNRGVLPPIGRSSQLAGAMDRPTIFPAGGEGYLVSYIATAKIIPGYSYPVSSIPSADLYACPELEVGIDPAQLVSSFSYRYNVVLGGDDKPKKMAAYGSTWNSWRVLNLPWKLSQVPDSTNMALFAEGDRLLGSTSVSDAALDTEPAKNANGLYAHNPRYGIYVHSRQAISGGYRGVTNVAYCDGSVRSVPWQVDSLYPKRQFEGTWINPYHTHNDLGWPSDNIH